MHLKKKHFHHNIKTKKKFLKNINFTNILFSKKGRIKFRKRVYCRKMMALMSSLHLVWVLEMNSLVEWF